MRVHILACGRRSDVEAIMPGNVKFQITLYSLKFQQAAQLEKWKLSPGDAAQFSIVRLKC